MKTKKSDLTILQIAILQLSDKILAAIEDEESIIYTN